MNPEQKKVIIIGGGFAGINLMRKLINKRDFHVTLVDKNNYNFFPPLLYQVATGFLEVSNISYPFRKLFQGKKNINFRLGELQKIISPENKILLSNGELHYDYLVLATGTESNYFGIENIKRYGLPMKTVNDAINLRNYMLQKIEEAIITTDNIEKKKLTSIAIVGAGPTGVEIAGMLAEMTKSILQKDYPELTGYKGEIYLIDSGNAVLAPMSEASQKYTYEALTKMGVKIKLHTHVKDYLNDTLLFTDGEPIETKTVIWAAGVTGKIPEGIPKESYGRGNRLLVDEFHKIKGTDNIYAIGDISLQTTDNNFPNGHPQVAQVAIQQGRNLAKNFIALIKKKVLTPFTYHDKGSMAIIGNIKAVAELPKPKMHFKGFIAWFMWLFIHLRSLITHRNQIKTLYNWMIAFFTKDQSLRLIIRPSDKT